MYYKTDLGILYDEDSNMVGTWNEKTQKIDL